MDPALICTHTTFSRAWCGFWIICQFPLVSNRSLWGRKCHLHFWLPASASRTHKICHPADILWVSAWWSKLIVNWSGSHTEKQQTHKHITLLECLYCLHSSKSYCFLDIASLQLKNHSSDLLILQEGSRGVTISMDVMGNVPSYKIICIKWESLQFNFVIATDTMWFWAISNYSLL